MAEFIQVMTTTGTKESAEKIARHLLKSRLAACAQVGGPVASRYWWKGELESREEWSCTIKTSKDLYGRVERAIHSIHPYDVPEIFALPEGAVRLARSEGCENQAFQFGSSVMGLQFHLEQTPESVRDLVEHGRHEVVAGPFIQSEADLLSTSFEAYQRIHRWMGEALSYLKSVTAESAPGS